MRTRTRMHTFTHICTHAHIHVRILINLLLCNNTSDRIPLISYANVVFIRVFIEFPDHSYAELLDPTRSRSSDRFNRCDVIVQTAEIIQG